MKIVRNYLTSSELIEIIDAVIQEKSAIGREIIKVGMTIQCVCEDIGEYKDCNDIYDKYIQEAQMDLEFDVKNYYVIDNCIEQELGIEKTLKETLSTLADINVDEMLQQLNTLKEEIK